MEELLRTVRISVHDKIYLKDPESSALGKRIVKHSIKLIHSLGFEGFTFRKLGVAIGSNESSVYRYFENKHKLLLYLTSWYWGWLEYQIVFSGRGKSAEEQLVKAIEILTRASETDASFAHVNEELLHQIVINENSKSYLTKEVDRENKDGYFGIYKRLVSRMSALINEVDAAYPYAASLASTVIEGALHQHFLMGHFPGLTNCNPGLHPTEYFKHLVFKCLTSSKQVKHR